MKILMVCLGNICRSPLADGILRRKAKEQGFEIEVDSAGTANYHVGKAPDLRMIKTAKNRGTDISMLRARQFKASDFSAFDQIFIMDENNYADVISLATSPEQVDKVKFLLNEMHPNTDAKVPDPYYGSQQDFEDVYDLVDKAIDHLLINLKKVKKI